MNEAYLDEPLPLSVKVHYRYDFAANQMVCLLENKGAGIEVFGRGATCSSATYSAGVAYQREVYFRKGNLPNFLFAAQASRLDRCHL